VSEQVRTVARTVTAGSTSFLLRERGVGGTGTPVLLLHGVPETATCWNALAPRLAAGRRVLAPDLPGLGGSTYTGPYDVASLVTELAALVDAEVGGRVDVVGHDWGGSLALGLAGARPDLVRRLVVANAPYRSVPARAVHIPFFALPLAPELLMRLGGRRVVDAAFAVGWKASTPLLAESLAEYRAAYTRSSVVQAMLGYYRAAARPRLAALVKRGAEPVPVPRVRAEKALVLWGAKDPILPVSTGETVVRDLGADCVMVTVPGAGHFVVEEAPEVTAEVLLDFLADEQVPAPPVHAAPPEKAADEHTPMEPPPAVLAQPPVVAKQAPAKQAPAKKAGAQKAGVQKAAAKKAPAEKATRAPATRKAPTEEVPPSSGA
jgi:pimeloyl-ACP methyl ester carboxylesterase